MEFFTGCPFTTAMSPGKEGLLNSNVHAFRRMLDTVPLDMRQFRWALVPALALLVLWELGKVLVRRGGPAATTKA